jgi:hypothetical protein
MDAFTSIRLRGRNKNTNKFDFYSDLLSIYPFAKKNKFLYVFENQAFISSRHEKCFLCFCQKN